MGRLLSKSNRNYPSSFRVYRKTFQLLTPTARPYVVDMSSIRCPYLFFFRLHIMIYLQAYVVYICRRTASSHWVNLIDVAENYAHVDQPKHGQITGTIGRATGRQRRRGIRFGFGLLSKRISINYILS